MRYKNSLDISGECSKKGKKAEDAFLAIVKTKKCKVREANLQEQFDHIDYILTKNDTEIAFDVKAMKKISRSSSNVSSDLVWVEFKNVSGKDGWLYGKAQYIAFEREDDYVIVYRKKLLDFCENNVKKEKVCYSKDALYKMYTRDDRKDVISIIRMNDLIEKLDPTFWKK
jgi:hypothetical protein